MCYFGRNIVFATIFLEIVTPFVALPPIFELKSLKTANSVELLAVAAWVATAAISMHNHNEFKQAGP